MVDNELWIAGDSASRRKLVSATIRHSLVGYGFGEYIERHIVGFKHLYPFIGSSTRRRGRLVGNRSYSLGSGIGADSTRHPHRHDPDHEFNDGSRNCQFAWYDDRAIDFRDGAASCRSISDCHHVPDRLRDGVRHGGRRAVNVLSDVQSRSSVLE